MAIRGQADMVVKRKMDANSISLKPGLAQFRLSVTDNQGGLRYDCFGQRPLVNDPIASTQLQEVR